MSGLSVSLDQVKILGLPHQALRSSEAAAVHSLETLVPECRGSGRQ